MSSRNEGFSPSILWPTNCPIHARTKITRAVDQSGVGPDRYKNTIAAIASPVTAAIPSEIMIESRR